MPERDFKRTLKVNILVGLLVNSLWFVRKMFKVKGHKNALPTKKVVTFLWPLTPPPPSEILFTPLLITVLFENYILVRVNSCTRMLFTSELNR